MHSCDFLVFGDSLPLSLSSVKLCMQIFLVCEYTVDREVEDSLKGKRAHGFLSFFFFFKKSISRKRREMPIIHSSSYEKRNFSAFLGKCKCLKRAKNGV